MISFIQGTPGAGKSKAVMEEVAREYAADWRDIVTNTPVMVEPWVMAGKRGQVGLRSYLAQVYKMEGLPPLVTLRGSDDHPLIQSFGHLLIVQDEAEQGHLFLWRRDRATGEWFKLEWDERYQQFDPRQMARSRGALVVTDEAWKCYNSRRWKDTALVVEFYGRQHRKFGDDWILVSHSWKDCDVQLARMTQKWVKCVNHGLRTYGVFRQPDVFRIQEFYEPPSPQAFCVRDSTTRVNPLLVQTYDTSGGVAVGGGRSADVDRKRRGLHWGFAVVGAILFVVGLGSLPRLLPYAVHLFVPHMDMMGKPLAESLVKHPEAMVPGPVPLPVVHAAVVPSKSAVAGEAGGWSKSKVDDLVKRSVALAVANAESNRFSSLCIEGVIGAGTNITVALSDGSIYGPDEISAVGPWRMKIDGQWVRWRRGLGVPSVGYNDLRNPTNGVDDVSVGAPPSVGSSLLPAKLPVSGTFRSFFPK